LSLERLLVGGTVLLVLALLATKLKPVTRFERAHKLFGSTQAILLVLTSFVIYVQAPLLLQVDRVHQRVVTRYRAARDPQWEAQAQVATAKALVTSVQSMTVADQRDVGHLIDRIDTAVTDATSKSPADSANLLPQLALTIGVDPPVFPSSAPTPVAIKRAPTSNHQLDAQRHDVAAQEQVTTRAEAVRAQVVPLALSVISHAISTATPIGSEQVKLIFEAWLGNVADQLMDEFERGVPAETIERDSVSLVLSEKTLLLAAAATTSSGDLQAAAARIVAQQAEVRVQEEQTKRQEEERSVEEPVEGI